MHKLLVCVQSWLLSSIRKTVFSSMWMTNATRNVTVKLLVPGWKIELFRLWLFLKSESKQSRLRPAKRENLS